MHKYAQICVKYDYLCISKHKYAKLGPMGPWGPWAGTQAPSHRGGTRAPSHRGETLTKNEYLLCFS